MVATLLLFTGCSVEKNTGASRFYHSLVSKYNIYFNGNEAYKAGVAKVKASNRDDYSSLLPVFEYATPGSEQACNAEMERAVQKASKLISLYSITARPETKKNASGRVKDEEFYNRKEYNEWVDDAYLLMAKARFYQKNYSAARAALSFNLGITTDDEIKMESGIWLARILTEEGKYSEAERILNESGASGSQLRDIRSMTLATRADIALKQKRYQAAIEPLSEAVELSSDKQTKVRFTYLLAQVCKAAGNNALSTRYFREVIRMNPSYDFEFNAGINLAGVADLSTGDVESLEKTLRKMIRDVKNKEYLDQIYFALGELARRSGETEKALGLYAMSAKSSKGNNRQKARAYLALGEHFYSMPDYSRANLYYDSAVTIIDRQFPDYETISRLASGLSEYSGFHSVVSVEDSLRRVALMPSSEREALIAGIIRNLEEEERRSVMTRPDDDRYNMGQYYENELRSQEAISSEGGWYFYNQTALTFGRTEFRRRWGDRKLEDNWRRANRSRQAVMPGSGENVEPGNNRDSTGVTAEKTKEYYLKNLPLSDSLMQESLRRSATALLGEGKVLASRLGDTARAALSLEAAAGPGGDADTRAEALYELYRMLHNTDPLKAERRREDLLSLFPESEYALILTDPDFIKKQNEAARASATLYETAYAAFRSGRYEEASVICAQALSVSRDDELEPKFMLLNAFINGALKGEIAYKEKLDTLVAKHPGTPEAERAAEIIAVLIREIPEIRIAEDTKIIESLYIADTLQQHYAIIISENTSANLNRMVFDVINFNLDNFADKNYRTEGNALSSKLMIVTTGMFSNAAEAAAYLKTLDPGKVIRDAGEARLSLFIISRDNLEKFRNDLNIERYRLFHEKTYSVRK